MNTYEDKRLGEYDSYDVKTYIDYDDGSSIVVARPCIFQCCTYTRKGAHRKFVRHYRKHKIHPYIKIFIFNQDNQVMSVCRLSIYHPKYITGYNENLILNKNQINDIMNMLTSEMGVFHHTVWQTIIDIYNNDLMMNGLSYRISKKLKMPNYMELLNKEG